MMERVDVIAPGAGVALISLFDIDGHLLFDETAAFARLLVDSGAASVLVCGSSGEFWKLDDDERAKLFGAVRAALPEGVPVIAHVGGVPLERAVELTHAAGAQGADAVIALPLGVDDLTVYYEGIIDVAGNLPVLAYHFPQAGAVVPIDELRGLGLAGLKDSSGDADRLVNEVLDLSIQTYTGSPALLGLSHDIDAAGALLGLANVHPDLCASAFAGDRTAQRKLAELSSESAQDFPQGLKRMVAQKWNISVNSRS